MQHKNKLRLLEFFLIGIIFGVAEDLIAISIVTNGQFEWSHLFIAIAVAVPFAFISEIIVDHPDFWKKVLPNLHRKKS